nr:ABC transporter ATP-binding protein/permease [Actinomycetes bacterium]
RIRIWTLAYAGQHVVNNLRSALLNRMVRFPMAYLDNHASGALTSRLISDAAFVYGSASGAGPQIIYSLVTVIGGVILLVVINLQLALIVLAVVPIAGLVGLRYGRRMRTLSHGYQNGLAATNALAAESLSSVRVIKWFSAESSVAAMYHRRLGGVIEQGLARARARARWTPAMMFLASCSVVVVVWIGGAQVQQGALSAGALVSFLLYARFVADGLSQLVTQYSKLAQAVGATERVFALLAQETESVVGGSAAPNPDERVVVDRTGVVEFSGVTFSYPGRAQTVLQDVDLQIATGRTVALVGASGAGKSTVTQLIARLYDVDAGVVRVDGVDVRRQDLTDLRKSMAVVPQDVQLLAGSIADNIRLGRRDASREAVAEAARVANAHDFIVEFPGGYGTKVGEHGLALSGGQRQRIAIARAVLADPNLLILDEATNALDAHSEQLVQQALERLMRGRTNLIIAHRLATVMSSDEVVVLSQGRVVEHGAPRDLLATDSRFALMVRAQSLSPESSSSVVLPGS